MCASEKRGFVLQLCLPSAADKRFSSFVVVADRKVNERWSTSTTTRS